MRHTILIPDATRIRARALLDDLRSREKRPGARLAARLAGTDLRDLTENSFLFSLIDTKVPRIFAESEVAGDGSDWTLDELRLLGDLSISVPVTVFDDGNHHRPTPHAHPFAGTLVFTPGALLRAGGGREPADWAEAVHADGTLSREGYFGLYERRLGAVFSHINAAAAASGLPAFVTVPGLGCGQFAGPFAGRLGRELGGVIERILEKHGAGWPHLRVVYFDPYAEGENRTRTIHGLSFRIRPLRKGNEGKSQLLPPPAYAEPGDDFSTCSFFSLVAWDHVSWPGNDFFAGARSTDDGVKAAATDSMAVLTGVPGRYDAASGAYLPPSPCSTWEDVVLENHLSLTA